MSSPHRGAIEHIKFVVRRSSPSLSNHPASELEAQSPDTKGYISSHVPAEIVLDLLGGSKFDLVQLQVLAHESKIPSKIEVFVSEAIGSSFRPVGFMEFDDNTKTGFMARELQIVRLDCENVAQVKLVLCQPHVNESNRERHVGIIGLNLLGWRSIAPSIVARPSLSSSDSIKPPPNSPPKSSSGEGDPIKELFKKVEKVRSAKESAVSQERYDEAKQLKNKEMELQRLAETAAKLDRAKQEAAAREDYEEAKRLKSELVAVLSEAENTIRGGSAAAQQTQQNGRSTMASRDRKLSEENDMYTSPPRRTTHDASSIPRSKSPPVPALLSKSAQKTQSVSPIQLEGPPPGFWDGVPDADVLPIAESLDAHLANSVDVKVMADAFGTYAVRCIYSADIRLRVAIVERFTNHIRAGKLQDFNIEAGFLLASLSLAETAPSMFLNGIKLLEAILDKFPMEKSKGSSFLRETIMNHVTEGLGNSSAHVQQAATDMLLRLSRIFGPDSTMRSLVSRSPSSKRSTLWKPILGRLGMIHKIIVSFESLDIQFWIPELLEWMAATGSYAHANEQVRDLALQVTSEMYSRAKDKFEIEDFLRTHLRQSTLDKYFSAFGRGTTASSRLSTEGRTPQRGISPSKRPAPLTSKSASQLYRQDDPIGYGVNVVDDMCPICGEHSAEFTTEKGLNMHFWRSCPMLGPCPHCKQVIEISHLNHHLLEECALKDNHRACPRCGEAIAAQLFEKHVRRDSCLPAKSRSIANRCPLCHQDIPPYEEGWRTHLMEVGCRSNVRTIDRFMDEHEEDEEYEDDDEQHL